MTSDQRKEARHKQKSDLIVVARRIAPGVSRAFSLLRWSSDLRLSAVQGVHPAGPSRSRLGLYHDASSRQYRRCGMSGAFSSVSLVSWLPQTMLDCPAQGQTSPSVSPLSPSRDSAAMTNNLGTNNGNAAERNSSSKFKQNDANSINTLHDAVLLEFRGSPHRRFRHVRFPIIQRQQHSCGRTDPVEQLRSRRDAVRRTARDNRDRLSLFSDLSFLKRIPPVNPGSQRPIHLGQLAV